MGCIFSKESATSEASETRTQQLKQQKNLLQDNIQTSNELNYDVIEHENEEPFRYTPLDPGHWFRILRLLPGNFEDPIQCELIPTKLDEAPPYEPLSYCWGDPKDKRPIICHGRRLEITINLFEALRRFRREDQTRLLWADAICINQSSKEERSHQVGIMNQVYERGECTLIWLGERPPDGADVAKGIELMRDINHYGQSEIDKMDKSGHEDIWDALGAIPSLPADHSLVTNETGWEGIRELLRSPYFTRLWVQQEIGLSGNAALHCGKDHIAMVEFGLFILLYQGLEHSIGEKLDKYRWVKIQDGLTGFWTTFEPKKSWAKDGKTLEQFKEYVAGFEDTTLDVLYMGRQFEASLQVDHIYSMLGHPVVRGNDGTTNLINADYTRSVEETSVILATNICRASSKNPLALLCYVDHWDVSAISGVPSWVPLLHERINHSQLSPRSLYDASLWGEPEGRKRAVYSFSDHPWPERRLRVAALLLDKVVACSDPLPWEREQALKILREALKIYESAARIPKSSLLFWHGLLYNLVPSYTSRGFFKSDFLAFCSYHDPSLHLYDQLVNHPWFSEVNANDTGVSADRFVSLLSQYSGDRKAFATTEGTFGLSLRPTSTGDTLAIVFGCPLPVMLRSTSMEREYQLVGQAWVTEYYTGNAVRGWLAGKQKAEYGEIELV
jgi:hypothetical protein